MFINNVNSVDQLAALLRGMDLIKLVTREVPVYDDRQQDPAWVISDVQQYQHWSSTVLWTARTPFVLSVQRNLMVGSQFTSGTWGRNPVLLSNFQVGNSTRFETTEMFINWWVCLSVSQFRTESLGPVPVLHCILINGVCILLRTRFDSIHLYPHTRKRGWPSIRTHVTDWNYETN